MTKKDNHSLEKKHKYLIWLYAGVGIKYNFVDSRYVLYYGWYLGYSRDVRLFSTDMWINEHASGKC